MEKNYKELILQYPIIPSEDGVITDKYLVDDENIVTIMVPREFLGDDKIKFPAIPFIKFGDVGFLSINDNPLSKEIPIGTKLIYWGDITAGWHQ